jgi:hypothetical protein
MKMQRMLKGILAGTLLMLGAATAQAQEVAQAQAKQPTVSPAEFRERMIEWAIVSEQAYKPGEDLAVKIASLSDEQIANWLALIENPEAFLTSVERVTGRQQEQAAKQFQDQQESVLSKQDEVGPIMLGPAPPLTTPFPPDYPPGSGAYKDTVIDAISFYGIGGASATNRCDASDWGDFIGVWWPLNTAFDALDGACVVAGCDPTGISCFVACGILETAKVALKVAAVPLEACDVHQGAIDGAELEAAYENTLGMLGDVAHVHSDLGSHDANIDADLAAHDANIDGDLAAHDAHINADLEAHDAHIDADLAAHDANLAAHDAHINADLEAHDAHINADLEQHDADIKALLDGVQETLDEKIELRRVHMQVLQVQNRQRYLVSTKEAGIAVSVDFLSIEVFNDKTSAFQTIPTATVDELEPGLYDVRFNLGPKSPDKIFRIRVRHDEMYDHFGEIMFNRIFEDGDN